MNTCIFGKAGLAAAAALAITLTGAGVQAQTTTKKPATTKKTVKKMVKKAATKRKSKPTKPEDCCHETGHRLTCAFCTISFDNNDIKSVSCTHVFDEGCAAPITERGNHRQRTRTL